MWNPNNQTNIKSWFLTNFVTLLCEIVCLTKLKCHKDWKPLAVKFQKKNP